MPCSHHLTNLLLVAVPSVEQQTSDPFERRAMECSERCFVLFMFVHAQKETHSMCSFSLTVGTPLKVMECLKGRSEEKGRHASSPKLVMKKAASLLLQNVMCTASYQNSYSNASAAAEQRPSLTIPSVSAGTLEAWLGSQAHRAHPQAEGHSSCWTGF